MTQLIDVSASSVSLAREYVHGEVLNYLTHNGVNDAGNSDVEGPICIYIQTTQASSLPESSTQILDRIKVIRIFHLYGLVETVAEIRDTYKEEKYMIVIDTISSLVGTEMGKGYTQGHAMMISVLGMIQLLKAQDGNKCYFINSTVSTEPYPSAFEGVHLKPALGLSYQFFMDQTMMLHVIEGKSVLEYVKDRDGYPRWTILEKITGQES